MLQETVDSNPIFLQTAAKNVNLFSLLLDHDMNISPAMVHEAIKANNVEALMLLKKRGVDFNDPVFIDTALATKSLACFSFLLDQQKNMARYDFVGFDKMVSRVFNNVYDQNAYKALLYTKYTGDAFLFENIISGRIASQAKEDAIPRRQEIISTLKSLKSHKFYFNRRKIEKSNKNIRCIDQIIATLSSAKLELLQEDKKFLRSLLKEIEKLKKPINGHLEYVRNDIKSLKQEHDLPLFFLNVFAFCLGISTCVLIYGKQDFDENGLAAIVVGLFGSLSGLFYFLSARSLYEDCCRLTKILSCYKRINYLEGFVRGLNAEDAKEMANFQKQVLNPKLLYPSEIVKICYIFASLSIGRIIFGFSRKLLGFYIFNLLLTIGPLFKQTTRGLWDTENTENIKKDIEQKLSVLLAAYLEKGKADGFARMNALKNEHNKFFDAELKHKMQKTSILDNKLFFKLLERCKRRENRQQSQEVDQKLAQSCKPKIKPGFFKTGFFKKCMNYSKYSKLLKTNQHFQEL